MMRKSLMFITMAALLTTACGHRTSQGAADNDSTLVDSLAANAAQPLYIDSVGMEREDSVISVKISLDWPVSGNEGLVSSVRQYLCEELAAGLTMEGRPVVKNYTDGKTAVETTVRQQYDTLMASYKESASESSALEGMQLSYHLRCFKMEETDTYVTFLSNSECFLGGAHGSATSMGMTFRKSDGKRIGYRTEFNRQTLRMEIKNQTLFSNPSSPQLAALIKEGVRSYFQQFGEGKLTDQALQEELTVNSVDSIPLPSTPPYFTKQGLCFVYQQYDIAPYAAGMVNFDIPYDKVRHLLTTDAQSLIKQ